MEAKRPPSTRSDVSAIDWRSKLPPAIASAAIGAWLTIAVVVTITAAPGHWDRQLFMALFSERPKGIAPAMAGLDKHIAPLVAALLLLYCVAYMVRRNWGLLGKLGMVAFGGAILAQTTKMVVGRPRPDVEALVLASGYSFPSAQVLSVTLVAGWAIYRAFATSAKKAWRYSFVAAGASVVFVVAYSRIYLGAHYPGDVAASVLIGASWLCMCIAGLRAVRRTGWRGLPDGCPAGSHFAMSTRAAPSAPAKARRTSSSSDFTGPWRAGKTGIIWTRSEVGPANDRERPESWAASGGDSDIRPK